jgi:hypothetical protein
MIELALVVGVLVAIAIIIVDFGKAINYWNTENHVANLGARYAAVGGGSGNLPTSGTCPNEASLTAFIDCELKTADPELISGGGAHGVAPGGATVCISVPNNAVGQPVTVKISAKYNWLPLPIGASFAPATLSGSATMRLEQPYQGADFQTQGC